MEYEESMMIYMVEMNLIDLSRRLEWDQWYFDHIKMLLSFPGFHATQRFECINDASAPFVALHHVDGPGFFKSHAYRNNAGPAGTGEWRNQMNNWNRNLFDGLETTPDIKKDQMLVLIEEGGELNSGLDFNWLRSVGLDMNVKCRGLAVTNPFQSIEGLIDIPGVRALNPLFNRLTKNDIFERRGCEVKK